MLKQGEVVEAGPFAGFEVIDVYSRAQALEDGMLVDVSGAARAAGIKYPVAVTAAVWADYVKVPEGLEGTQDESGRLWDVVWMFRHGVRSAESDGSMITFQLYVRTSAKKQKPELVTLKAVCGPGDDPKPVVTIMECHES